MVRFAIEKYELKVARRTRRTRIPLRIGLKWGEGDQSLTSYQSQ